MNLRICQDKTPLSLQPEEKANAVKTITDMISSLSFLRELLISSSRITKETVDTHLGLNISYHTELAKILDYDSILAKQDEERRKDLREANQEIQRLEHALGAETTPDTIRSALLLYDTVFCAWYKSEGFRFAADSVFTAQGIRAILTSDICAYEKCPCQDVVWKTIWRDGNNLYAKQQAGWDLQEKNNKNEYVVLDTDANRLRMETLILNAFPHADILEFSCRRMMRQEGKYELRTQVLIPYEDIFALYQSRKRGE